MEGGGPSPALAAQLLTVYGKVKDRKLRRDDLGLDQEAFDRLDVNRDGAVAADELTRFALVLSPDAEFIVRLGTRGSQDSPVDIVQRPVQARPLPTTVNQTASGLICVLGADLFDLRRDPHGPSRSFNERESYLRLFQDADAAHQGFIERKDLKDPTLQQLCPLLPLAGNRLTEKDLTWASPTTLQKMKTGIRLSTMIVTNSHSESGCHAASMLVLRQVCQRDLLAFVLF